MKYNITSSEIRIYDRAESCVFKKNNESFGDLSNMSVKYPLIVNGIQIRTTEALYQICRFPDDVELQNRIINEKNPMKVKMISNANRKKSRKDWDEVKIPIMRWCLNIKLAQNLFTFGEILNQTGNKNIVENSSRDNFWGAIPDEREEFFTGKNALGRLLMELRGRFQSKEWMQLLLINPPEISDFLIRDREVKIIDERANFIYTLIEYWDQTDSGTNIFDMKIKQLLIEKLDTPRSSFGLDLFQGKINFLE